jgi:hypothetical protein
MAFGSPWPIFIATRDVQPAGRHCKALRAQPRDPKTARGFFIERAK